MLNECNVPLLSILQHPSSSSIALFTVPPLDMSKPSQSGLCDSAVPNFLSRPSSLLQNRTANLTPHPETEENVG